ncbi:MAG: hypothetical protein NVS2B14_05310 [Chamaesiphon sp.]
MAKIPIEITQTIVSLKQQLLDIINSATVAEFELFERLGETDDTIIPLNDLRDIAEQAASRFSQLSTLQLRAAQSHPIASTDLLQFLNEKIVNAQQRVSALERSIEEIKQDWELT